MQIAMYVNVCGDVLETLIGIATITPKDAKKYLKEMNEFKRLKKAGKNVPYMELYPENVKFISLVDATQREMFEDIMDAESFKESNVDVDDFGTIRTEGNILRIEADSLMWVDCIKYTSDEIFTCDIDKDTLKKIAKE